MRQYYVEVWTDGEAYEKGQAGEVVKVKARDDSHAEDVAMRDRQYEVACVIGLVSETVLDPNHYAPMTRKLDYTALADVLPAG